MLNPDRLIELRKKNNYTQEYMAKKLGIDRTSYGKYETYHVQPANDILVNIAKMFGVSTDYLLNNTNIPTPINENQSKLKEPSLNEKALKVYDELKNVGIDLGEISETEYKRLLLFIDRNKDLILERTVANNGK